MLREKRSSGAQILDLTESNPTSAGLSYPETEIIAAFNSAESLRYRPEPRGLAVARQAVVKYYHECGHEIVSDRVHLTSSTSEGYAFLFKLLANPGDQILVPQPSYPLFEFLAALDCVELRSYSLHYNHPQGWRIDFDMLEAAITSRTRAIIVVNPNNPTGSFVSAADRNRLSEICLRHDLAIIADEVFADFSWGEADIGNRSFLLEREALTFVMSGLSKVVGLPQMKLGWIVTGGRDATVNAAQRRLDIIADTYLSVSTPVQLGAENLLSLRFQMQAQINARTKANREYLESVVGPAGSRVLTAEGGWYAIVEIPRYFPEEEWVLKLLAEDNVLVHPGYFFNFEREAFLVFSLLPRPESFQMACRRIRSHF